MDSMNAPKPPTFTVPPGVGCCLIRWTSSDGQNYSFFMDLDGTESTYGPDEPKEQELPE